jgi:hypothetical protein
VATNFPHTSSRSRSGWSSAASIISTGHGASSGKRGQLRDARSPAVNGHASLRINHAIDSDAVGAASRAAGSRPVRS